MPRPEHETPNLLECIPRRLIAWDSGPEGRVVLQVPRFRSGFLARWLQPRLSNPFMRVRLDERGSWVWQRCDGSTTVAAIARRMAAELGEPEESTTGRVVRFVRTLARDRFVTLHLP